MFLHANPFGYLSGYKYKNGWVILCFVGVGCLFWAFSDSNFRDTEGFLSAKFCLPLSLAVALIISGIATSQGLYRFGFWIALGMVGQAMGLQLVEAGQGVRYQHYPPLFPDLAASHPVILLFLALQSLLVFIGMLSRWKTIRAWYAKNFRIWQLVAVGLLFFLSSATVSHEIFVYLTELLFAGFLQAVNLGNIILIAWSLPGEKLSMLWAKSKKWIAEFQSGWLAQLLPFDIIFLFSAVWVTALAAFLNFVFYEQHPHLQDEVGYLFHARFLANGAMKLPAPPIREAFEVYLMQFQGDNWFPSCPPGWPAMLALGIVVGFPWLVNPILAGINVVLAGLFFQEIYGKKVARLGVLLLCISPWYLFMGMNFMPHMFTLTCTLIALISVALAMRTGKNTWSWIGGGAVGMGSLIRPLDGVIVALILGIWVIAIERGKLKVTAIVGLAIGTIIIGALAFPYNKILTGDPFVFPIMAYADQYFAPNANAYGFGPERGMGWPIDPNPGHSPVDGLINANLNTFSLNIELFGWSAGSLLLSGIFLVSGTMRRSDCFLLVLIGVVFIAYFFYYFSGGPDFGARYWFLMIIPLIGLTARGIRSLEKRVSGWREKLSKCEHVVKIAVFITCFFSLVNFLPWRSLDKYYHYLNMRPDFRVLLEPNKFDGSLVLIRGEAFPDYASAVIYSALIPSTNDPIYAWYRSPIILQKLLKKFQQRPVWIIDGPTITDMGYEVRNGPLSAKELLAYENRTF